MIRRILRATLPVALLAGVAACNADRLAIPSYNAPSVDGVANDPAAIQLLATGLLITERAQLAGTNDNFGRFGREHYDFFPTDARNVSNFLSGITCAGCTDVDAFERKRLDPGGFANGIFLGRFTNMRNAVNLIAAINISALSAPQKEAGIGFAKTFYGLDLLYLVESRDTLGVPVEITVEANAQPAFVSRDSVYRRIFAILDSADTHLAAGGTTFPFLLHTGFTANGFSTIAQFRTFNRAIRARATTQYAAMKRFDNRGNSPIDLAASAAAYTAAAAALGSTYIAPVAAGNLSLGPQYLYSTTSGDQTNGLSFAQNTNIMAHAALCTATDTPVPGSAGTPTAIATATAQNGFVQRLTAGGALDNRSTAKVVALTPPRTAPSGFGITAHCRFSIYAAPGSPATVFRNEELNLLRAEIRWFTGDKPGAVADLNAVRQVSGGFAATNPANANGTPVTIASSDADFITALLYERTMSLMLEGRRWVDYRRFGRLLTLPRDDTRHFHAKVMPVPKAECDARVGNPNFPAACTQS